MQYCSTYSTHLSFIFLAIRKKSNFVILSFERNDTPTMKHLLFIMCTTMLCVDDVQKHSFIFSSFFGGIFSRTIFLCRFFHYVAIRDSCCVFTCRMYALYERGEEPTTYLHTVFAFLLFYCVYW